MPEKDEERFWFIDNRLFAAGDNKVRDHNHVTGKQWGSGVVTSILKGVKAFMWYFII